MNQAAQFKTSDKLFVCFNTHNGKVAFAVFGNENRLRIIMAERGYFIVVIAQICAGTDCWHIGISFYKEIVLKFLYVIKTKLKHCITDMTRLRLNILMVSL